MDNRKVLERMEQCRPLCSTGTREGGRWVQVWQLLVPRWGDAVFPGGGAVCLSGGSAPEQPAAERGSSLAPIPRPHVGNSKSAMETDVILRTCLFFP